MTWMRQDRNLLGACLNVRFGAGSRPSAIEDFEWEADISPMNDRGRS